MFLLLTLAFAGSPNETVDWREYDAMARSACRDVRTKRDYAALAAAQMMLVGAARDAVASGQLKLLESRFAAHSLRLGSTREAEQQAYAEAVRIEAALAVLGGQGELLSEWAGYLALEVRVNADAMTPKSFPRRVLRRWCLDSFAGTRVRAQSTIDLLMGLDVAFPRPDAGTRASGQGTTD